MAENRFFSINARGSNFGGIKESQWKQPYLGDVQVNLSNSNSATYKIVGVPASTQNALTPKFQPAIASTFNSNEYISGIIFASNNTVILIYSHQISLNHVTDVQVLVTVKSEWAADKNVDTDIKIGEQTLLFIKPIPQEQINILIKQINLSKFVGKNRDDIQAEVIAFLDSMSEAIGSFPQFSFSGGIDNSISEDQEQISKLKAEIADLNKKINNTLTGSDEKAALNAEVAKINDKVLFYQTSVDVKKKFVTSVKASASGIKINFNKFYTEFLSTIMAVFDSIEPNSGSDTEKKKQNTKIRQEAADEVRAGLAVDKAKQDQETQRARLFSENQIIEIEDIHGTNLFTRTTGLDKALSILDVLRTEESAKNFIERKINVKTNQGSGPLSNQDSDSVCRDLLSKFSATDLQNMIKSLDDKITANNSAILKTMIDLKKMQGSGGFKFMTAFSGITGVDFSNSSLSFPDLDFASIKNGLKNGLKSVKDLAVNEIGSEYGKVVSLGNDLISAAKADILGIAQQNMNLVDFNAVLKNIDAPTLSKCPTLSSIKKTMQNPGDQTKKSVDQVKNESEQAVKSVNEKLSEAEALSDDQKQLKEQKQKLLDLISSGAVK